MPLPLFRYLFFVRKVILVGLLIVAGWANYEADSARPFVFRYAKAAPSADSGLGAIRPWR